MTRKIVNFADFITKYHPVFREIAAATLKALRGLRNDNL